MTAKFWGGIFIFILILSFAGFQIRTKILINQKKQLEKEVTERTEEIRKKNIELEEKYKKVLLQEKNQKTINRISITFRTIERTQQTVIKQNKRPYSRIGKSTR